MNDEHKEKIYYIQQQADELSAEISKLMKKDADLSEKHLNDGLSTLFQTNFFRLFFRYCTGV